MNLNDDPSKRVVLRSAELPWQSSRVAGVDRRLLARDGGEDARAASIVRYMPGAAFPSHAHPQDEEIVVLDGEFTDEHGAYRPAGVTYRVPVVRSHGE